VLGSPPYPEHLCPYLEHLEHLDFRSSHFTLVSFSLVSGPKPIEADPTSILGSTLIKHSAIIRGIQPVQHLGESAYLHVKQPVFTFGLRALFRTRFPHGSGAMGSVIRLCIKATHKDPTWHVENQKILST